MPERKYVAFFSMSVYYSLKLAQLSDKKLRHLAYLIDVGRGVSD